MGRRRKEKLNIDEIKSRINERVRGKIVAAHDVFGHHYKFVETGEVVDSVTTRNIVEQEHLTQWKVKKAIEFLEKENRFMRLSTSERPLIVKAAQLAYRDVVSDAGDVGTAAHSAIEDYCNEWINTGKRPHDIRTFTTSEDYRVLGAIRSAERAFINSEAIPIASELLVGEPSVGAGTLDLLVMNKDGNIELWDFKTSNSALHTFYANQVAAYKTFFERMSGLTVLTAKIYKLDKYSDKFVVYRIPHLREAYRAFVNLSKYYDWYTSADRKVEKDIKIISI